MATHFSQEDRKKIETGILGKYAKVAKSPEGLFRYPTGRAGLEALNYDPHVLKSFPPEVLETFCGVGNPFSVIEPKQGDNVLDIGCGAGVDALIAARLVGNDGKVIGVDMSVDMVITARKNVQLAQLENVEILEGSAEALPFSDQQFDVVLSSGVFNLVPDKMQALREVFRVMKSGGVLAIADQILTGNLDENIKTRVDNWAG